MKKAARIIILTFAALFALMAALGAFLPLNHKKQNAKNLIVLADMRDRVEAVREFNRRNDRLPTKEELAGLSSTLPVRYARYEYHISTNPASNDPDYPENWPATGGWVLSFRRGKWRECYSSWDDRYTLSKQLTAWDDYGLFLAYAAGLGLLSRVGFLHNRNKKPNKAPEPIPLARHGSS